ncbi:MAG TPA: ABC transporter permease subunit [Puia sp.]|uniref:ABC transporter permease subunit n=1 Tax=Puia sp. TaxID=2045100 RepID=UPI002BA0B733|nr:ABC transporter permease subunit [Puia sp.]HVU94698.1 ABC transporter permease subunit [Puia sp.]
MRRITAILYYDWLQMIRSASFVFISGLLLCIGIYALYYGHAQVRDQQENIARVKQAIDSTVRGFYHTVSRGDTTALEAYSESGTLFANYPRPLAALSFGQRDVDRFALNLATYSFFYDKYSTGYKNKTLSNEIVNPMRLLAGNLDLSFVLIFLMPLYLILLSYNIISGEKEAGTLDLLGIQTIRLNGYILTRLLFRLGLMVVIGGALIVAGAFAAHSDAVSTLYFSGVYIGYSTCWAGIVLLFCRSRYSGTNALTLITAWLMLCFVLPALYNALLNAQHPIHAKTRISNAVQRSESDVYPLPNRVKLDSFLTLYPRYRTTPMDSITGYNDARWWACTYGIIDHDLEPIEEEYQSARSRRIRAANRWNYGSPALLAQYAFNQLAASNAEQLQDFDTLAYRGFCKRMEYFDSLFFLGHNQFTLAQFKDIPLEYEYHAIVPNETFTGPALLMLAAGVLLLAAGYRLVGSTAAGPKNQPIVPTLLTQ